MARVLRAHGVRGGMVCEIITDFPERFAPGVRVYIGSPPCATEIQAARCDARTVTLNLAAVCSRDEVDPLRGSWILVQESDAHPLPDGQYYWYQLIGLQVQTDAGEALGELVDVLETGSNNVYVIKRADRELLLPAIPDVILEIDLPGGMMTVHLLPGLDAV
ncbi:MAG: ribosome maturation factor RimM [Chloroflexota bacterium]